MLSCIPSLCFLVAKKFFSLIMRSMSDDIGFAVLLPHPSTFMPLYSVFHSSNSHLSFVVPSNTLVTNRSIIEPNTFRAWEGLHVTGPVSSADFVTVLSYRRDLFSFSTKWLSFFPVIPLLTSFFFPPRLLYPCYVCLQYRLMFTRCFREWDSPRIRLWDAHIISTMSWAKSGS